ncbi:sulfite exporter TauE/SafE family protein [Nocardioides sp. BP30]|uniref:sulfite exporter TauE/SafE family protein n=1 Tax=Nocardioides sp. BP30 TaxID=3036374 RepID=UPI00246970E7|nr:sulfite exporter TauE/SafE family protein [Nocardioides sp. BP30]WGL51368.1 sulfite exporter TauE/SafE family protein [Nocardioides sp. BP30]
MRELVAEAFLAGAGVAAGVIGTAGGITSLVAYPALLAVGIPPLAANVTNSVALLGSGISSALRAGPDVVGRGHAIRAWLPAYVALSLAGAALLVLTPGRVFDRIVPYLVATGALVLLLQPAISRWQRDSGRALARPIVAVAGGAVAVYNGYFGAGAGILLITLLLLTVEPVLHRANSLKNVILVGSDVLPAVLFAVLGSVVWHAMWPLALGAVVGGLIGPAVARRLPAAILRVLIALCGFVLAGYLLTQ